jgi:DNA-binding XRE family transcriptional regulator
MEEEKQSQKTKSGGEVEEKKKTAQSEADDAGSARPETGTTKDAGPKETAAPAKTRADAKDVSVVSPKASEKIENRLREFRIERMMSKAELARKAGLSVLTVARIEKGFGCRMDTKRKILKALGLRLADRRKVFEDE